MDAMEHEDHTNNIDKQKQHSIIIQKYNKLMNDFQKENLVLKKQVLAMQEHCEEQLKQMKVFETMIDKFKTENIELKNNLNTANRKLEINNEEKEILSGELHREKISLEVVTEEYNKTCEKKLKCQLRSMNNLCMVIQSIFQYTEYKSINVAFQQWKGQYLDYQNKIMQRKQKSHNKELIKVIDHLNNRLKIITKNEYNLKIKLKIAEEACTVLCSV